MGSVRLPCAALGAPFRTSIILTYKGVPAIEGLQSRAIRIRVGVGAGSCIVTERLEVAGRWGSPSVDPVLLSPPLPIRPSSGRRAQWHQAGVGQDGEENA